MTGLRDSGRSPRTTPVDRRPDGLWDGCADDPISAGDAHAVAAGWLNTTQLANALDAAAFELERATARELRLAQALRVLRDTGSEYTRNVAARALDEAGIPDPPEEDHP